jgi:hypothetical protein
VLHFAAGMVPPRDPSSEEPAVLGWVGRCAVPWYRVEPYSRLIADDSATEGPYPGFRVGPPSVDPNTRSVQAELMTAYAALGDDPHREPILDYFMRRHPQVRAFDDEPFRGS